MKKTSCGTIRRQKPHVLARIFRFLGHFFPVSHSPEAFSTGLSGVTR